MTGRKLRKAIAKAQRDLIEYQRSHWLSAGAHTKVEDAKDILARARYAQVGQEADAYEKAQRILNRINDQGIRGIAFGEVIR